MNAGMIKPERTDSGNMKMMLSIVSDSSACGLMFRYPSVVIYCKKRSCIVSAARATY